MPKTKSPSAKLTDAQAIIKDALTQLDQLASRAASPVVRDYAKLMRRDTEAASHIHATRLQLRLRK